MAKLQNYKGSVTLISGIKQANGQDFPLAEANAIQIDENGKRLDEVLDELNKGLSSSPIKSGTDESGKSIPRTAVFEGNKVYTKGGVSLGQNTSAGGKCFILRSGKKETKGCSLVVGFMTDEEFNTLSGLVAGGLYVSARLDYNFDGYKVTKIEKVTDGKVTDGDVRFTLDSELRVVTGKNWYAESNFPDRLTADKAACVSVGTNTPENTVKTATLWVIGHPEIGTFGIDELVDTDGNIVSADARGYKTSAVNIGAFAAGRNSNASGKYSVVFGDNNNAGYAAFAAGKSNTAYPECSVALGQGCVAGGINAVATGFRTKCNSENGFTSGLGTKTTNKNEVAVGSFNVSSSDTLFSIGKGADNSRRKNAFEVKQNGDVYIEGKGYAGGKELANVPEVSAMTGTTVVIENNKVFSMGECTSLSVSANDSMKTIISASELVFVSGSTATVFSSGGIVYKGNDCADGIFTPVINKRYSVMYGYNGTTPYGLVLGFEVSV